jgi:hypothetical protein
VLCEGKKESPPRCRGKGIPTLSDSSAEGKQEYIQQYIPVSDNVLDDSSNTFDTPASPNPDDFWCGFAPEPRVDLQKSGLLPIIQAAGLYTARPGDINRLAGFEPERVNSTLVTPTPALKTARARASTGSGSIP